MTYLAFCGFTLFAVAVACLIWQEIKHHKHTLEMKEWAEEVLDLHADLIKQMDEDTDVMQIQAERITVLEGLRDYLISCNNEIYDGYIDAARTVANMEASVTLLDELLTQAEDAGIENAKRILGGIVTKEFNVDSIDEDVDIPIAYYLPDQDQG